MNPLQVLLDRYAAFIDTVDGYAYSIYDYDNDLSVRIEIEEALLQATSSSELEELARLDSRFRDLTVETPRTESTSPWFSRLPRKPGEDLREDIESGNL